MQLQGVCMQPDESVWLVQELMEGGDLWGAIGQGRVTWARRGRRVALDIARGLHYLHSQNILHLVGGLVGGWRGVCVCGWGGVSAAPAHPPPHPPAWRQDLKSPNVLLKADGSAKICDVGLSRMLTRTHVSASAVRARGRARGGVGWGVGVEGCARVLQTRWCTRMPWPAATPPHNTPPPPNTNAQLGTWQWAAPEILLAQRATEKSDIFSFGVVLWEVATGQRPERGLLREIRAPEECPEGVKALIDACLRWVGWGGVGGGGAPPLASRACMHARKLAPPAPPTYTHPQLRPRRSAHGRRGVRRAAGARGELAQRERCNDGVAGVGGGGGQGRRGRGRGGQGRRAGAEAAARAAAAAGHPGACGDRPAASPHTSGGSSSGRSSSSSSGGVERGRGGDGGRAPLAPRGVAPLVCGRGYRRARGERRVGGAAAAAGAGAAAGVARARVTLTPWLGVTGGGGGVWLAPRRTPATNAPPPACICAVGWRENEDAQPCAGALTPPTAPWVAHWGCGERRSRRGTAA